MPITQKSIVLVISPKSTDQEYKVAMDKIKKFALLLSSLISQDIIAHLKGSFLGPDGFPVLEYPNGTSYAWYFVNDEPDVYLSISYNYKYAKPKNIPLKVTVQMFSRAMSGREISIEEFLNNYPDSFFAKKAIFNLDLLKSNQPEK